MGFKARGPKEKTPAKSEGKSMPAKTRRRSFRVFEKYDWLVGRRLLLRDDGVLQTLAETELERRLGGNLDRLARLRVAPLARLALGEDELAALLDLVGRQVSQLLEKLLHLCALQLVFFGEVVDHFGL